MKTVKTFFLRLADPIKFPSMEFGFVGTKDRSWMKKSLADKKGKRFDKVQYFTFSNSRDTITIPTMWKNGWSMSFVKKVYFQILEGGTKNGLHWKLKNDFVFFYSSIHTCCLSISSGILLVNDESQKPCFTLKVSVVVSIIWSWSVDVSLCVRESVRWVCFWER